jgi:transposase InsO family protein
MQAWATSNSTVWHERLAHPGPSIINTLKSRCLIPSTVKASSTADCHACAVGKGKRTRCYSPDALKQRPQPGQILHADLCFPKGLSPDCLLTVVDEGSRFPFAFPLRAKSEAAKALQDLILQLERKGFKPHTQRTDNGGEFISTELKMWHAARGIEHVFTPADTPQANGLIDRYHGTLMPRLRAVLNGRKIPRSMWSEVLQGVVYVSNRTPHQGIGGKILYEQFYQRELSSLAHLRVLGSVCYYHLPGHKSKLDPRMQQAILVGYSSDGRGPTAAYTLYDSSTKRVVISTDVIFDERPTEDPVEKRATCTTTVPQPPGVVVPLPTSSQIDAAVNVSATQTVPHVSPQAVHTPSVAPTTPVSITAAAPSQALLPESPDSPAHEQHDDNIADQHPTCEEPRRSKRCNKGVPPDTFTPGLLPNVA